MGVTFGLILTREFFLIREEKNTMNTKGIVGTNTLKYFIKTVLQSEKIIRGKQVSQGRQVDSGKSEKKSHTFHKF